MLCQLEADAFYQAFLTPLLDRAWSRVFDDDAFWHQGSSFILPDADGLPSENTPPLANFSWQKLTQRLRLAFFLSWMHQRTAPLLLPQLMSPGAMLGLFLCKPNQGSPVRSPDSIRMLAPNMPPPPLKMGLLSPSKKCFPSPKDFPFPRMLVDSHSVFPVGARVSSP